MSKSRTTRTIRQLKKDRERITRLQMDSFSKKEELFGAGGVLK